MNSRELVEETLNFDSPATIPRHVCVLPWAEEYHPVEVTKLSSAFPDDIISAPVIYNNPPKITGEKHKPGEYVDEWGCKFSNLHDGVIGIVHDPIISDWADLKNFTPPEEALSINRDEVNAFCHSTEKFVIAGNFQRPFERFQFIRTMEQAMFDLLLNPPELEELLKLIHDHYCREVETWAKTDIDAIFLMDDWGGQQSMLVSPEIFRRLFKPMYMDYVEIAKQYNKYVFMHSDGYIMDIIPDFIELGIDALNSQIFCMDIPELGKRFGGKITFWGEIDRQDLLPNGSREDIIAAVNEVNSYLNKNGGVIAQCEFGPGANPENVYTVYETWNKV
ncbi:MAG: uroporphyrinogen decarboxylase family protein [Candidatus Electryonea clarkiae]|nr:uroporphyrinogen decarboxylase family protein [Candidatus Electryonea clarkiae]MDP8289222.1 uroporphyrinogen decarboxylase family protein [Candidatus Electryonea clarkiae]